VKVETGVSTVEVSSVGTCLQQLQERPAVTSDKRPKKEKEKSKASDQNVSQLNSFGWGDYRQAHREKGRKLDESPTAVTPLAQELDCKSRARPGEGGNPKVRYLIVRGLVAATAGARHRHTQRRLQNSSTLRQETNPFFVRLGISNGRGGISNWFLVLAVKAPEGRPGSEEAVLSEQPVK